MPLQADGVSLYWEKVFGRENIIAILCLMHVKNEEEEEAAAECPLLEKLKVWQDSKTHLGTICRKNCGNNLVTNI